MSFHCTAQLTTAIVSRSFTWPASYRIATTTANRINMNVSHDHDLNPNWFALRDGRVLSIISVMHLVCGRSGWIWPPWHEMPQTSLNDQSRTRQISHMTNRQPVCGLGHGKFLSLDNFRGEWGPRHDLLKLPLSPLWICSAISRCATVQNPAGYQWLK